ncbi:DNA-binding beta-propeller fold protein YncE [Pedobacter africanus]|uniref:DNA-binding beta-propeller fold protein YncE n=1 Tax=Pedobacter africanus TaxID=151894 RepID=A0ACC6KTH9_9SPHI|nr:DUF5074 domain-containing protein [Pedobacter africanus]MDR6782516.1 DNA-binding beta-propeller fold protein YncE [Pedobacter africanus]
MMNKLNLFTLAGLLLAFSACKKEKLPPIDPQPNATTGVYVLCEGPFGQKNKSTITYYEIATKAIEKDYFKKQNGIDLGTGASALKQYGSKMYCMVTGDNSTAKDAYVEVISIATGKSIKRIPFYNDTKDFSPRNVAFYKGKAYISCYDGFVTKVDTASLNIEARLDAGGAMEEMAIVNNKLYITNSLHPYVSNPINSSVSVVDLNSFTKLKEIAVSFNANKIAATATGDLFVITRGQYLPFVAPAFEKLSSVSDSKIQTYAYDLNAITVAGTKAFVITGDYPSALKTFNITNATIGADFITDGTTLSNVYGVTVDPLTNDVYVADATDYSTDGNFFCFAADGKKKFEFATGTIPQNAVFKYSYK